MNEPYIVFGKPRLSEEHIQEVVDCLKSGWIGRGPRVSKFENLMKDYLGVSHTAALSSCTAALHLSILGLGIGPGDEVIVPSMTFAATANAVLHAGAIPVFVDCQKNSPCLDPKEVEKKITSKTKAIILVHMHGERAPIKELFDLASARNIQLIEDAAHALELKDLAKYSKAACFSFYPNKNITTIEGGLVASFDEEFISKVKIRAQHGLSSDAWKRFSDDGYKHYLIEDLGFKYNMTDVQASLGIHEVPKIEQYRKRREEIWKFYSEELKSSGLNLPTPASNDHAMYVYAPRLPANRFKISRDQLINRLHEKGIGTGVHYLSLCEHPYYQRVLGVSPKDCPNAFEYGRETFSIPFSQHLTDQEISRVAETLNETCKSIQL